MLHEPNSQSGPDAAGDYKTRLGIKLFLAYCVVYATFVLVNVVSESEAMAFIVGFGLNLAVVYGFGLILLAMIMAIIYNWMCSRKERELAGDSTRTAGEEGAKS